MKTSSLIDLTCSLRLLFLLIRVEQWSAVRYDAPKGSSHESVSHMHSITAQRRRQESECGAALRNRVGTLSGYPSPRTPFSAPLGRTTTTFRGSSPRLRSPTRGNDALWIRTRDRPLRNAWFLVDWRTERFSVLRRVRLPTIARRL